MQGEKGGRQGGESGTGSKDPATRVPLSEETLEAARRREPDALAELFERCFGQVYSLAYRLTGEHGTAEDVAAGLRKVMFHGDQPSVVSAIEPHHKHELLKFLNRNKRVFD